MRPLNYSTHGEDFVPMVGPEREIADILDRHIGVGVEEIDAPCLYGVETAATEIVRWLQERGVEL